MESQMPLTLVQFPQPKSRARLRRTAESAQGLDALMKKIAFLRERRPIAFELVDQWVEEMCERTPRDYNQGA
jgi:hypothetical protein